MYGLGRTGMSIVNACEEVSICGMATPIVGNITE